MFQSLPVTAFHTDIPKKLSNRKIRNLQITLPEVKSIVAADEKQRFSLIDKAESPNISSAQTTEDLNQSRDPPNSETKGAIASADPAHFLIRANQGHSMKVSDEGLHKSITIESNDIPSTVAHGTQKHLWPKILASGGLKPMKRQHVHFATGVPKDLSKSFNVCADSSEKAGDGDKALKGETPVPEESERGDVAALPEKKNGPLVLSGMRNTSTLLIFLDLRRALKKGLKFWLSENGVVLCPGNEKGVVPVECFERVVEKGGTVLVKDGKLT